MELTCILYGFPCEKDFSHHKSPNPTRVACDETNTNNAFSCRRYTSKRAIVLNILRKVVDHENHVGWIYRTTVLNMGKSG